MTTYQLILAGLLGVVLAAFALLSDTPQASAPTVAVHTSETASSTVSTIEPPPQQKAQPSEAPTPIDTTAHTLKTEANAPAASPAGEAAGSPEKVPETTSSSAPSTPTQPVTLTPTALNEAVRNAVVNIICTSKAGGPFNSISATGVFIDTKGVILTNSHVAQYFLLQNYPSPGFITCTIRTGSPAYPAYTARLLFISPSWVAKNASKISSEEPTGNGEHDYALLLVTGTVSTNAKLPPSFPALPIAVNAPDQGQTAFLAAYPAGFLGGITVAKDLYQSSAFATIGDLFTFEANTLDLFSIGGTILSQHGSSGGAVTDENGVLIGLIVTATDADSTASRDLRAISTRYIISDFSNETHGTSLESYLNGNLSAEADTFNAVTAPALTAQLVNALETQ